MKIKKISIWMLVSSVSVCSLLIAENVYSQTRTPASVMTEPLRWTQEDVTPAQKFAAAKKELVAAKFEAVTSCNSAPMTQRNACLAQAESIYTADLKAAQLRFYPVK